MTWWRRLAATVALAGLCAALVIAARPVTTDAAWTDSEIANGGLASGRVIAPTQLTCRSAGGVAVPLIVDWPAPATPADALTRTGYRWTVTGGITASGTISDPAATSITFNIGLLGIGSGQLTVYAVGPGGWERPIANTLTIGFLTSLITSCTRP